MELTTQDKAFLISFAINMIITIASLILFPIFKYYFKNIYEPRCKLRKKNPPPPPDGPIAWMRATYNFSEEEIYKTAGLDAMVHIRFFKITFRMILLQSIYCFAVLFPVYISGPNKFLPLTDPLRTQGLIVSSMSNLDEKSPKLWANVISVYYSTIVALIFLYFEAKVYEKYRVKYKMECRFVENYTSVITEIPVPLRKGNALQEWFDHNFPNWKILEINKSFDLPKLTKKYKEREDIARKFEKAQHYLNTNSKRLKTKNGCCNICGDEVDAVDFFRGEVEKIEDKIDIKRQEISEKDVNPVAFVTFDSIQTQEICSQVVLDQNLDILIPQWAPDPRAIKWRNLYNTRFYFFVKSIIVFAFTFFLILFFLIPVTFVMTLTNLSNLAKISWLKWLADFLNSLGPVVKGFIEGYLPTIIMAVCLSVLIPLIVRCCTNCQGHFNKVKIEISFFEKMFLFNVVNVFLGSSIAGSFFTLIQQVADNPSTIITVLAASVPKQANFFTNYVMLLGMTTYPLMELLRVVDFVFYFLKTCICKTSLRILHESKQFAPFAYSHRSTQDLLVFLIVTTYSTMYPFILIFGIVYFAMGYMILKYNFCYVRMETFKMGGMLFPHMFSKMCYSLIFYQVVSFAVLLSYKFYYTAFIFPPIVITIIFRVIIGLDLRRTEKFCSYHQSQDYEKLEEEEEESTTPEEEKTSDEKKFNPLKRKKRGMRLIRVKRGSKHRHIRRASPRKQPVKKFENPFEKEGIALDDLKKEFKETAITFENEMKEARHSRFFFDDTDEDSDSEYAASKKRKKEKLNIKCEYKNVYLQPTLKPPDEIFLVGQYGEFEFQSKDIAKAFKDTKIKLK